MRASKATAKSFMTLKKVIDDANGVGYMIADLHCQVCNDSLYIMVYAHLLQIESWAPFTYCGCTHGYCSHGFVHKRQTFNHTHTSNILCAIIRNKRVPSTHGILMYTTTYTYHHHCRRPYVKRL